MNAGKRKHIRIRSGTELINNPVPKIEYRILGLLRANGGRMSLTGQYKMMKSLLAHDLGLRVAAGDEWLGFSTIQGNVLYINLEISAEKLQERIQDIQEKLCYNQEILARFMEISILESNLSLDSSTRKIQNILNRCQDNGLKIDMLILDPRARLISGSENEEVIIKRFCDNIDKLISRNPGLSVVIVTHMGKDPSKGAIGHSRFSGWLDTEIKISIYKKKSGLKILEIVGRDTERTNLIMDFSYPLHEIVEEEESIRVSKVDEAMEFIISRLTNGKCSEQNLRRQAKKENISDYAFHTAIKKLKDKGTIKAVKAKGQGNRKVLKLIKKDSG